MSEYGQNRIKTLKKERIRPYLLTILGLVLVFGFFFAVMLFLNGGGGLGGTNGSGTGLVYDGRGSGAEGSGRGYGSSGPGVTDGQKDGPGAGSQSEKKKAGTEGGQEKQQAQLTDGKDDGTGVDERLKAEEEYRALLNEPPSHMIETAETKPKAKHRTTLIPDVEEIIPLNSKGSRYSSGSGSSGLSGEKGFFGVKTQGNVIFVVDVSGSMADRSTEGIRIDLLKNQLKNAIRSKKGKKYVIIAFSSGFIRFPKEEGKMCSFQQGLTSDVESFINSLNANGGTELLNALQGLDSIFKMKNIDTLFLLTDGEPQNPWNVITEYIEKNIPKKIKINTVSIGRDCPEMQTLSASRNGTYVVVR